MKELVVATTNKGKLREIKELLADLDIQVTSLADYPQMPEIIEDGHSFQENALKKAKVAAAHTKKITLGEDSGLEVKALDNAPGIYSARFSGVDATDEKNNEKLLEELTGVPMDQRQARYRCCAAIMDGDHVIDVVEGDCEGVITVEARGSNGFGYDPYFLIPEYNRTFGELDPAIKAKISHRAKALKILKESLKNYLEQYI